MRYKVTVEGRTQYILVNRLKEVYQVLYSGTGGIMEKGKVELCEKCKQQTATTISRMQKFCDVCLQHFISAKQRKQMMGDDYFRSIFKVKYADRVRNAEEADQENAQSKVLVALSFGSSSLAALDIVNDILTEQRNLHSGKTGFSVDILTVYVDQANFEQIVATMKKLKLYERYHDNRDFLRFHLISADAIFQGSPDDSSILRSVLDSRDFRTFSIHSDQKISLQESLNRCDSRAARQELLEIAILHVIKTYASRNNHKAILWGHSMTKLADQIMSLIVTGRGAQISSFLNTSNFDEQYQGIFKNLFPLKDCLLTEIDAFCYSKGLEPFLFDYSLSDTLLIHKFDHAEGQPRNSKISSLKEMTVNQLARKYFDDIENDYSNVIATVVRTGDKLGEPEVEATRKCQICHSKIYRSAGKWLSANTVTQGCSINSDDEKALYEKWQTVQNDSETSEYIHLRNYVRENGAEADICYGCISLLNVSHERSLLWPNPENHELASILEDYELVSD